MNNDAELARRVERERRAREFEKAWRAFINQ